MHSNKQQPTTSSIVSFEENGKEHLILITRGLASAFPYQYSMHIFFNYIGRKGQTNYPTKLETRCKSPRVL